MKIFDSGFKYHKTLAPQIWNADMSINPLVSQSLQMMIWEFIHYMQLVGIPLRDTDIRDIVVYGSITDFYWDKHSDIDIRIMADLSHVAQALPKNTNWVMLYKAMFWAWRNAFRLSIFGRGIDISMYDTSGNWNEIYGTEYTILGPAFSLMHNTWVQRAVRLADDQIRTVRRMAKKRCRVIMRQAKYIIKHDMSDIYIDAWLLNLRQLRHYNLDTTNVRANMTSMNMAYKMFRNRGMLSKMRRLARKKRSKTYNMN